MSLGMRVCIYAPMSGSWILAVRLHVAMQDDDAW